MANPEIIVPNSGNTPLLTQQGVGTTPGYNAIDIRRYLGLGFIESVRGETAWKVVERIAGANMSVDVKSNEQPALVQGDAILDQGLYYIAPHNLIANLPVAAADGSNPRIDLVVLEIKDDEHDSSNLNLAQLRLITGTPTAGATLVNLAGAPAIPASAMALAYVLVPTAALSVLAANIDDVRVIEETGGGGGTLSLIYRKILVARAKGVVSSPAGSLYSLRGDATEFLLNGIGSQAAPNMIYLVAADYLIDGKDTKLRVRLGVGSNQTAMTNTFTAGLYPLSFSGTSGSQAIDLGTVVAGSTVAVASPAVGTFDDAVSADFDVPAEGLYTLGFVSSNSVSTTTRQMLIELEQHYI